MSMHTKPVSPASSEESSPLVSIIMNCYNASATLQEALDSVLAQSYTAWEIIFFDSASTDHSLHMARAFAHALNEKAHTGQECGVMHCIAHPRRVVLGEARSRAVRCAQGQYIAFLDCDDVWMPQKLALQVACLQAQPHMDVVCTNTEFFSAEKNGAKLFDTAVPARGHVFATLVQRQWMVLSSVMLRAQALHIWQQKSALLGHTGVFDPCLQMAADADVFYRLAYAGQCDFIAQVLTRRRMHEQNITLQQWEKWSVETRFILAKLRRVCDDFDENFPHVVHILTQRALFQEAVALWRQGRGKEARIVLFQKGKHWSFTPKKIFFTLLSFFSPKLFDCVARMYFSFPAFLRK